MSHRVRRLIATFPRSWRARYGIELETLIRDLEAEGSKVRSRDRMNIIIAGLSLRMKRHAARRLAASGAVVVIVFAAIGIFASGTFTGQATPRKSSTAIAMKQAGSDARTRSLATAALRAELATLRAKQAALEARVAADAAARAWAVAAAAVAERQAPVLSTTPASNP